MTKIHIIRWKEKDTSLMAFRHISDVAWDLQSQVELRAGRHQTCVDKGVFLFCISIMSCLSGFREFERYIMGQKMVLFGEKIDEKSRATLTDGTGRK